MINIWTKETLVFTTPFDWVDCKSWQDYLSFWWWSGRRVNDVRCSEDSWMLDCRCDHVSAPTPEPELASAPATWKLSEDQLTIRKNLKKFNYFVRKVKELVRYKNFCEIFYALLEGLFLWSRKKILNLNMKQG